MTGLSTTTLRMLLAEKREEIARLRHRLRLGARPAPTRTRSMQADLDAHVPIIHARIAVLDTVIGELQTALTQATADEIDDFLAGKRDVVTFSKGSATGRNIHDIGRTPDRPLIVQPIGEDHA